MHLSGKFDAVIAAATSLSHNESRKLFRSGEQGRLEAGMERGRRKRGDQKESERGKGGKGIRVRRERMDEGGAA